MSLIEQLKEQQKAAMRAKEKVRLGAIRMLLAAIKQQEVDSRKTLSDDEILSVIVKMCKQRKDSISQFQDAGRDDLAEKESQELAVLEEFLPQPLTEDEVDALITQAIADSGAASVQDMGKVMGILKPQVQGRADMGAISGKVRAKLA